MKGSTDRIENIPYTLVLHNNVYVLDTIFFTMVRPLVDYMMRKWLEVIIRGTYQVVDEDIRWAYEKVSNLWIYVELVSDSSDDGSSGKGIKDQENLDDEEHEELLSYT